MKNSFFSRFTPQEPKFFPMLKRLSEILTSSSDLLVESMQHDKPEEREDYYKRIKDMVEELAQAYQEEMAAKQQETNNQTAREWLLDYENRNLYQ